MSWSDRIDEPTPQQHPEHRGSIWSRRFWADATERASKTVAQVWRR